MKHQNGPNNVCPFDSNHKTPSGKLQSHFTNCNAKQLREKSGLPIFRCKYNPDHIYLEKQLFDDHQKVCLSHSHKN